MYKNITIAFLLIVGFGVPVYALQILFPTGGGTGWGTIQADTLLTGNGTDRLATTTVGSGLVLSGGVLSAVSSGTVGTSTNEIAGYLPYWTTTSGTPAKLGKVATTTLTASSPLSLSQPISVIGSSPSALTLDTSGTWSGLAGSASVLSPGRNINGVAFNGSANITIQAASSTLLADQNTFSSTGTTTFLGDIVMSHPMFITTHAVRGDASDGIQITANNYTQVATFGVGNTANALFLGGVNIDGATRLATSLTGLLGANAGTVYSFASSSLFGYVPLNPTRNINTTFPILGGGDLSADRTLTFGGLSTSSPLAAASGLLYATGVNTVASVATSSAVQMSITGNAGTVTTNANLSGVVTSVGNTTSYGSQAPGVLGSAITGNTAPMSTTTLYGALGTPGQVLMSSNGAAVWAATSSAAAGVTAVTATAPIFSSGGLTPNITWAGLATTSQPASSNLLVSNGGAGVFGVATSAATCGSGVSCTGFNVLGASNPSFALTAISQGVYGNGTASAAVPSVQATSTLFGVGITGGYVLGYNNTTNSWQPMATSSGGTNSLYATSTLTGNPDGITTAFTAANTPYAIYVNGVRQQSASDYNISGSTVTFTTAPANGSSLTYDYTTLGTGVSLPLSIANGGTAASSMTTSGNGIYYNGTVLATAPLTSPVTYPFASTTMMSSSDNAFLATAGGGLRVGTSTDSVMFGQSPGITVDMQNKSTSEEAIFATGNVNDFLEMNIWNRSAGTAAQSCFTGTRNDGTGTTGFLSGCVNGTGFNNPQLYNMGNAGDSNLLSLAGDMWIGNGSANRNLYLTTSGTAASTATSTIRLTVAGNTGNVGIGSTTPWALLSVASSSASGRPIFAVATSTSQGLPNFMIDSVGHLVTSGPAPVVSLCGSSPSVVGNDTAGKITTGTGVFGSCTLTFANTYTTAPSCVISAASSTVGIVKPGLILTSSTTATQLAFMAISTSTQLYGSGLVVSYICLKTQ